MSGNEIKYPWNLINEIFKDTCDEENENMLDGWIYRSYSYDEKEKLSEEIRKNLIKWRMEKYISRMLTVEEKKVVELRLNKWVDWQLEKEYKLMPWNQIAKEMGYRSYHTAQDVYARAVSKLKTRERFLAFSPKLTDEEREYLLNTVEGGWDEYWEKLFQMMERIPGFEKVTVTNIGINQETAPVLTDDEKT